MSKKKAIACPKCKSTDFKVQQYTWNEQPYNSATGGWGVSENYDYECEKVVAVICEECEEDCSALFRNEMNIVQDTFPPRVFCACMAAPAGHEPDCPELLADFVEDVTRRAS